MGFKKKIDPFCGQPWSSIHFHPALPLLGAKRLFGCIITGSMMMPFRQMYVPPFSRPFLIDRFSRSGGGGKQKDLTNYGLMIDVFF